MPTAHLHHQPVGPRTGPIALFLHGILGQGSNLGSLARRFVADRPGWGALLVDLRMHGRSQGQQGPHTVTAAARDLLTLCPGRQVRAAVGHSLGGKVAMAFAAMHPLDALWILDARPGTERRGDTTYALIDVLRSLPAVFDSRDAFVAALREAGQSQEVARWLAMSIKPAAPAEDPELDKTRYRLALDLDAMQALLDDYFAQDLWHVLEAPPEPTEVGLIIAGRGGVFDAEAQARAQAAAQHPRVSCHLLAEASHFVHVDALEAVAALLAPHT